jgi:hypothetical protein
MATTAGHSFYIGPIGFFYNQVNDTGSWEPLVFLFIFLFTFCIYRKLQYLRKSYRNKIMMRILVQIHHPLGKNNKTRQEMARDNLEVTEDVDFYPLMSLSGRKRYNCSIYYFYFIFILLNLWKEILNCDGQPFHQYQQNEQLPLTSNHWTQKSTTYLGPCLGLVQNIAGL